MTWLLVAILAYLFLAIVLLFDRYFLAGPLPSPKAYAFYVGILGFFACFLILPFGVNIPIFSVLLLGLIAGLVRIFAILFLSISISKEEVSRVVPAVGGLVPIFSFFLFLLFLPQTEILTLSQVVAFVLLIFGSILISLKKISFESFSLNVLKYPLIAAFLLALSFFLTKTLFLKIDFLTGIFLILFGSSLGAIILLAFSSSRKDIFGQKLTRKISGLFLFAQALGGLGVILQFYSIFLAKPFQVSLINALEGIIYVFLLIFIYILSKWNPDLLKEEMRGANFFQKILATLLIVMGLAILAFL